MGGTIESPEQRPSPNFSLGRVDTDGSRNNVELIVIHYIVGPLSAADAVFANPAKQVSAHYGIGEGQVHQYVQEVNTAWHAGNFTVNTKSIGIEHSADQNRPPDQFTYDTSIALCTRICRQYRLNPRTAIIPHMQVVATLCPGTVDIQRIINAVAANLGV